MLNEMVIEIELFGDVSFGGGGEASLDGLLKKLEFHQIAFFCYDTRNMKREHWKSRLGFIWAAVGSAIGLGSIWRFPYVVGENGGATFILLYLICLVLVGFPVLLSEITLGRKAQLSPFGTFRLLGRNRIWGGVGKITIVTGFLVSTFYGVICGWTLGYLLEAFFGTLMTLDTPIAAKEHFQILSGSGWSSVGYFLGFMFLALMILYTGVRKGIEKGNKIMMPLLLFVLVFLVIRGVMMPGATEGLKFLFSPDWSKITPNVFIMALGQAFFSLSLGQGTMVTYGSYVAERENLPATCVPIALFGIFISILAGIAIFTIVFATGVPPASGMSLMFETLPVILSKLTGGYFLSILFFVLLLLAGLTSQISALEPMIAFLTDRYKWGRHKATTVTTIASFALGIPCALSMEFLGLLSNFCVNVLIPLGGLAAVILMGWRWGFVRAFEEVKKGTGALFDRYPFLKGYFGIAIKYLAPLIIILIFLDALHIF